MLSYRGLRQKCMDHDPIYYEMSQTGEPRDTLEGINGTSSRLGSGPNHPGGRFQIRGYPDTPILLFSPWACQLKNQPRHILFA